uniref:Uncharacterized protein n=1 Tax=Anguilla anguilla TaxID=7936 RepID=A0A0E9XL83_ANGAN
MATIHFIFIFLFCFKVQKFSLFFPLLLIYIRCQAKALQS